jgi:hypothetical protein
MGLLLLLLLNVVVVVEKKQFLLRDSDGAHIDVFCCFRSAVVDCFRCN